MRKCRCRRVRTILHTGVFSLCFFLIPLWSTHVAGEFSRDLPLNRFSASRHTTTDAAGFYRMPTALGDDYFDGTSPVSRLKRHFVVLRKAGVKYLRCGFSWNGIEPEQGKFRWQFWDTLVAMAQQNGIELIPYVAYTPPWAARGDHEFWKQPPRDFKLYADFMREIVTRYQGRVRSWEIWNEPDNKDYWTGTADEFAELAMQAARSIRSADPDAVLVLGGMANGPGEFFRTLITRYHLDRYVDVVAMHAYPESWLNASAETIFDRWVPEMAQLIAADHSGDDLWVNEMGYPDYRFRSNQASIYGTNVYYAYEHTRTYQASMLFKMQVMALATEQVSLTGWYRIDDFPPNETRLGPDLVNYHLGVEDSTGRPKPALSALAFFNLLFGLPVRRGKEQTIAGPDSQATVEVFERKDGKMIFVGWLRSSQAEEVKDKSGTATDRRSEFVRVELPCAGARLLGLYDPQGRRLRSAARLQGGWLTKINLRGGRVVVAELGCAMAKRTTFKDEGDYDAAAAASAAAPPRAE